MLGLQGGGAAALYDFETWFLLRTPIGRALMASRASRAGSRAELVDLVARGEITPNEARRELGYPERETS